MEQPRAASACCLVESALRMLEHYATKADLQMVRTDLQAVKTDLTKEMGRLEVKIERMSWRILAAMVGGIMAALVAALSVVLRFLVTA